MHDVHRCYLAVRRVAMAYSWWSAVSAPGLSECAARGDHRPAMVDVLTRAKDGTCGTEDDHPNVLACPFRKGTGDVDEGIHQAHGLGRARCGAIELRNDLAACPRAF